MPCSNSFDLCGRYDEVQLIDVREQNEWDTARGAAAKQSRLMTRVMNPTASALKGVSGFRRLGENV